MRRTGLLFSVLLLILSSFPHILGAVTSEEVNRAIERASGFILSRQGPDGAWRELAPSHHEGVTALAVYSLLNAGVSPEDPAIRRGIQFFSSKPLQNTYIAALNCMALGAADPVKYRSRIREAARWLVNAQRSTGGWRYGLGGTDIDNSCTQFALLGLDAARRAGVAIPESTWRRARNHYQATRNRDGGWGYQARSASTGSMTAAGVAGLLIIGGELFVETDTCGVYKTDPLVQSGIAWLARHFSVTRNPGGRSWLYYYLYALERVGMLSGLRYIGDRDWFAEGAEFLLKSQEPGGSWGRASIVNTSFALLFLVKGRIPAVINKLRWAGDWNNDMHDAAHLSSYASEVLGWPMSWQVVDLSSDLEELLEVPILYFNGHTSPRFTASEIEKLRRYVEQGGFLLAEACCGRKEFDSGFRALVREIVPYSKLEEIPKDHPIYHSFFDITDGPPLLGVNLGCRLGILYSPTDLSCAWEKMEKENEMPLKMGTNIIVYATGAERLKYKLSARRIPLRVPEAGMIRGAVVLAQVKYAGDWLTDRHSLDNLMRYLSERADVTVGSEKAVVTLKDPDLYKYPLIYMTGHYNFHLDITERQALKNYLSRGGALFAEACCGRKAFDESFRELMRQIFPENPLEVLPPDHPIFSWGYTIDKVQYRPALREEFPGEDKPRLEAIFLEGRPAVIYSPYSIGCGLEPHPCFGCRGYEEEDSVRLAINIVLYLIAN